MPQNLRMGGGGRPAMGGAPLLWPPSFAARSPRSEARHSCDLPRRGAHSYLRSGGGGVRDRSTWSESNPASRGATHAAYLGASTLSLRGGGREGTVQHGPRATQRAEAPLMRRTSARSTLVPCLRDINNKVAPPLSRLRHKGGPSSEVAFHLCGLLRRGKPSPRRHHDRLLTPRCSNPLKAYERPTFEAAFHLCGHLSRGIHTPLDALQLIHGRGEPLKARQRPPTFEAAGHICGRLRSRCLAPSAADEALHRGAAHRSWPSAGCVSR